VGVVLGGGAVGGGCGLCGCGGGRFGYCVGGGCVGQGLGVGGVVGGGVFLCLGVGCGFGEGEGWFFGGVCVGCWPGVLGGFGVVVWGCWAVPPLFVVLGVVLGVGFLKCFVWGFVVWVGLWGGVLVLCVCGGGNDSSPNKRPPHIVLPVNSKKKEGKVEDRSREFQTR